MADDARPGYPFMLGVYGIEPNEETVNLLKETGACGVLLHRRNIVEPAQVVEFRRMLEYEVGHRLLFALTHEGGYTTRFTGQVTQFPSPLAIAETGIPEYASGMGNWMGRELRSMKVDINLAPVLDVASPSFAPWLITRSFGSDSGRVGVTGAAMIRGMLKSGVLPAVKHFPGQGASVEDPHDGSVTIKLTESELDVDHIAPFRQAIQAGVPIIMTSHALFPALDNVPATFSSKIVTDRLRDYMGFNGVIMTDDLCMGAVESNCPVPEAAVKAARAGHDILLVAHDPELQRAAVKAYQKACRDGSIDTPTANQNRARIEKLLQKAASAPQSEMPDAAKARALAGNIAWSSVKVVRDPVGLIPAADDLTVGFIVPRLRDLMTRFVLDESIRETGAFVQNWIEANGVKGEVLEIPADPPESEVKDIMEWARGYDTVVDFCFDATRLAGQKRLLRALEYHTRSVAVLAFHPWDENLVPAPVAVVQTYGFQPVQLEAAMSLMFKGK